MFGGSNSKKQMFVSGRLCMLHAGPCTWCMGDIAVTSDLPGKSMNRCVSLYCMCVLRRVVSVWGTLYKVVPF